MEFDLKWLHTVVQAALFLRIMGGMRWRFSFDSSSIWVLENVSSCSIVMLFIEFWLFAGATEVDITVFGLTGQWKSRCSFISVRLFGDV